MPLGPERDLLLASLRLDSTGQERISALIRQELDWAALFRMAATHEILPCLYQQFAPYKTLLDPQAWQALRAAYMENATRNVFLSKTLLQILGSLQDAGIAALTLKGPALAVLTYNDLTMRQYVDLDILIHPADFDSAVEVLTRNGWLLPFQLSAYQKAWLVRSENDLPFNRSGVNLELHWDVAENGVRSSIPRDLWWKNTQKIELLERQVLTVSAENTFLYLCLHGTKHGWTKYKYLVDLAHFLNNSPDLDWQVIFQQAQQFGLQRSIGLGLTLAQRFCGINLSPSVSERCERIDCTSLIRWVERKQDSTQPSLTSFETVRFIVRSKEKFRDRLFFVFDQLFVPKQADWLEVSLPPAIGWLYYLYRPFRLVNKFGRAILIPRSKQS